MSTCITCGTENTDDSQFCGSCGAALSDDAKTRTYVSPRLKKYEPPDAMVAAPASPSPLTPPPPSGRSPAAPAALMAPPVRPRRSAAVTDGRMEVQLRQSFRFIHEPVGSKSSASFVGRKLEIDSFADRILFSDGGSFLVTGYRGVGKTSFVNQVIRKLAEEAPRAESVLGHTEIVDVYLNVARPMQPAEMMHHIIRRMNDRLIETGIYNELDDELRDALKLAYDRTSVNMARKVAEVSERSFGVNEASIGGDLLKAAMKLSWTAKRSRTNNYETSYLGYDDKAAEHDIISLSRRLAAGYTPSESRAMQWWNAFRGKKAQRNHLKIIFVFDELDKLEELSASNGDDKTPRKPAIDEIIGSLKNLFTTSGVSFIFVAGKDLQERWLDDVGRGDSVYESVFAYDKYLPCLWADVGMICDAFVDGESGLTPYPKQIFDAFKQYLAYRGRGIPRRIIRTFNEYVEWDENQPSLRFDSRDVRRVRFFAGLQRMVDDHQDALFGDSHEEFSGTQSDKRRLGVYYLIDWILGRGTIDFTLKDVLEASRRLSVKIALAEEIAPRVAEDILSVLVDADYIQVAQKNLTQVFIQAATGDAQKRYRVTPRRLVEMGGDREGVDGDGIVGLSPKDMVAERERIPSTVANFRILREIGRGGMGVVYEGMDEGHGQRVAVKVLNESLTTEGDLARRFEREAMILKSLEHPNIVRLVSWGREALRLYIAMEFLDGVTVEQIIRRSGGLPLGVVIGVGEAVARAVEYVHQKGFVRNDIKPSNIMITATGRVCLLDFGISRPSHSEDGNLDTKSFVIIGTPQFMAPEQFTTGVDERSDVYSLGVVIYRMLTGEYPFAGTTLPELMRAHMDSVPLAPSLRGASSDALDDVVLRCLAKDPADRFQTTGELAQALSAIAPSSSAAAMAGVVKDAREVGEAIDAFDGMRTVVEGPNTAIEVMRRSSGAVLPRMTPPPVKASSPFGAVFGSGSNGVPQANVAPPAMAASPPPVVPLPHAAPRPAAPAGAVRGSIIALVSGLLSNVATTSGPNSTFRLVNRTTVGRNSENDIVLRGLSVSRYHAVFDVDATRAWFVEDANSGPGTFVNGEPVIDRRTLRDGDEIRIGEFVFVYAQ